MEQASIYLSRHPSKLIFISALLSAVVLGYIAGNFSPKFIGQRDQESPPQSKTNLTGSSAPNMTVNVPIESTSFAVKSLYVVYLLSGTVSSISETTLNGKNGYDIELTGPTGTLINRKFFASDKTTNVVRLDPKGKETKYQLPEIKKGDQIQLNFQWDVKKSSELQVTKIAVLK